MADTIAELASLLKLGPDAPLQPPRFAKVVSVADDTVTVTLGASAVEAVRCCHCVADDIVLLETMPSGQLAAVATKGATGGTGVQSLTIGTVTGATLTNSGTATDPVLNLTVPTYSTLTCTENSGGQTLATCMTYPSAGWGWREEKWSDGRLSLFIWAWYTLSATTSYKDLVWPADATAFTDFPVPTVAACTTGQTQDSIAISFATLTVGNTITLGIRRTNSAARVVPVVTLHGHWR